MPLTAYTDSYSVRLHKGATGDLGQMRASDPTAFSAAVVVVQEILTDPSVINGILNRQDIRLDGPSKDLTGNGDGVNICSFKSLYIKLGKEIWRAKALKGHVKWEGFENFCAYRLFFSFFHRTRVVGIISVVKREGLDDDIYDPSHSVCKIVSRRYDDLLGEFSGD